VLLSPISFFGLPHYWDKTLMYVNFESRTSILVFIIKLMKPIPFYFFRESILIFLLSFGYYSLVLCCENINKYTLTQSDDYTLPYYHKHFCYIALLFCSLSFCFSLKLFVFHWFILIAMEGVDIWGRTLPDRWLFLATHASSFSVLAIIFYIFLFSTNYIYEVCHSWSYYNFPVFTLFNV
jgi:hypothetical protein